MFVLKYIYSYLQYRSCSFCGVAMKFLSNSVCIGDIYLWHTILSIYSMLLFLFIYIIKKMLLLSNILSWYNNFFHTQLVGNIAELNKALVIFVYNNVCFAQKYSYWLHAISLIYLRFLFSARWNYLVVHTVYLTNLLSRYCGKGDRLVNTLWGWAYYC